MIGKLVKAIKFSERLAQVDMVQSLKQFKYQPREKLLSKECRAFLA